MALRAKKPETIQKRLKMLVYGAAGVGKTTAAIQFPNNYIIDMERGAENYANMIQKSNSVLYQTTNPEDIRQEIRSLLTENHTYRTLTIDPLTMLYSGLQEKWTRVFEKYAKTEKEAELQDFGFRYWARVKSEYKGIQRLMLPLDMNVIATAHEKDVYGLGMQKTGVSYDSMKGDNYFFDYVFRLEKRKDKRFAIYEKVRVELGMPQFPDEFEWSYENFCKYYGREIIEKEAKPLQLALSEQIDELKNLIDVVKIDEETINSWLAKAGVEDWSEMRSETIQKCIDFVKKKLEPVKGPK